MDSPDDLTKLLMALSLVVDAPDGPGGGAICLDAVSEIERLQRMTEPNTG